MHARDVCHSAFSRLLSKPYNQSPWHMATLGGLGVYIAMAHVTRSRKGVHCPRADQRTTCMHAARWHARPWDPIAKLAQVCAHYRAATSEWACPAAGVPTGRPAGRLLPRVQGSHGAAPGQAQAGPLGQGTEGACLHSCGCYRASRSTALYLKRLGAAP